jgi:hypothetical protein
MLWSAQEWNGTEADILMENCQHGCDFVAVVENCRQKRFCLVYKLMRHHWESQIHTLYKPEFIKGEHSWCFGDLGPHDGR